MLDTLAPVTIATLLGRLALRTTLFVVTSRSDGAAETMAEYLIVRGRLGTGSTSRCRPCTRTSPGLPISPGVALGERFTHAMPGPAGIEDARREWDPLPRSEQSRVV